MAARQREPQRPLVALLAEVSRDVLPEPITYSDSELARILSPRHFIEVRCTPGGPAPEETARAIRASRQQLEADEAWAANARGALATAERKLAAESAAL